MKPIPRPLHKKLVLTFLAGTGCFFTGLILSAAGRDPTLFALSAAIFFFSLVRGISLYRQIRSGSYRILEGICSEISRPPFGKTCRAVLTDLEGMPHALTLPREYKVAPGLSYRIYLRNRLDTPSDIPHLLENSVSADNLLAVEQIVGPPQNKTESEK